MGSTQAEAFLVVGAGQAGQSLVENLRKVGFEGRIVLIGEEPVQPYQRPPLSKTDLLGEMSPEPLFFRLATFCAEQGTETRWGAR